VSAAEPVEPRAGTKGNAGQQSTGRTQNREPWNRCWSAEGRKGEEEGEVHRAPPAADAPAPTLLEYPNAEAPAAAGYQDHTALAGTTTASVEVVLLLTVRAESRHLIPWPRSQKVLDLLALLNFRMLALPLIELVIKRAFRIDPRRCVNWIFDPP
jgi:hypothetical protein